MGAVRADVRQCQELAVTGEVRFVLGYGIRRLDNSRQVLELPAVDTDPQTAERAAWARVHLYEVELNAIHIRSLRVRPV
jgi:hypothetical protein